MFSLCYVWGEVETFLEAGKRFLNAKNTSTYVWILSRLLIVLGSKQSELSRLDIELIMISKVGVGVGAEIGNQGGEVDPGSKQDLQCSTYLKVTCPILNCALTYLEYLSYLQDSR